MNYTLNVLSQVWNKESNSLFDYESTDYTTKNHLVLTFGHFVRHEKHISFIKEKDKISSKKSFYIFSINKSEDNYLVTYDKEHISQKRNIAFYEDKPWIAIKQSYSENKVGLKLRANDIIKIGKIGFKVKEVKSLYSDSGKENLKTYVNEIFKKLNGYEVEKSDCQLDKESKIEEKKPKRNQPVKNYHSHQNVNIFSKELKAINSDKLEKQNSDRIEKKRRKKSGIPLCRICLSEDMGDENPLMCPCKCSGTMKYIHIQCIKYWLKSKLNTKKYRYLIIHSFKNLECELCKVPFPGKKTYDQRKDYEKPDNNYILLESLSKERAEKRFAYIICFQDTNEIKIGRANDSDVRISDISVSRNHAKLVLRNGNFYLEDTGSKFGSLLQLHKEIIIIPSKPLVLQSGKAIFSFTTKRTFISYLKCYKYKHNNIKDYSDYFDAKEKSETREIVIDCGYRGSRQQSEVESVVSESEDKTLEEVSPNIQGGDMRNIDTGSIQQDTMHETSNRLIQCNLAPQKENNILLISDNIQSDQFNKIKSDLLDNSKLNENSNILESNQNLLIKSLVGTNHFKEKEFDSNYLDNNVNGLNSGTQNSNQFTIQRPEILNHKKIIPIEKLKKKTNNNNNIRTDSEKNESYITPSVVITPERNIAMINYIAKNPNRDLKVDKKNNVNLTNLINKYFGKDK